MSKRRTGLKAIIRAIDHSPDRSSLFWWLFDHHDEIRHPASGKRITWAPVVAQVAALGLTDRDGKPATPGTVRLTWYRVRQEVARRRAAQLTGMNPARHQPSRAPADWQPPVARYPPQMRPGSAGQAATPTPSSAQSKPSVSGAAPEEDSWDRAWRRLDERSGR